MMTAPFVESHQPNRPNLAAGLGLNSSSTYGVSETTRKALEQLGYRINVGQGPIGDGGSAYVFAATHPELEGTVAIKIAKDSDPVRIAQFDRERKVLASNSQINDIVPKYYPGTGPSNCQPFIVMERIRGDKILDYAKNHRLDVERKIELIQRMFQAVHQLHLNNLTHGDPSPNNVYVQAGDRIRLIDFGQSKRISKGYLSVNSVDGPSGTPGYAPDSQLSGTDRASVQTDMHAYASIAYELLTSENRNDSTQSKSPESTSTHRRESESVFLAKLASNHVPQKVATIIARAMRTKDPTKVDGTDSRLFHSANDVVQAIEAWRIGRARTRNWIRSSVASLLLAVLLVFVSVWGYGQFLEVQRTQRRQSISTLQQEISKITNGSHPAVKQRLLTVDQKLATFHSAESTGNDSKSDEAQRQLVETMRELLLVSRKLERVIPLREALGIVLEKMPWVQSAPSIAKSKNELAQRYLQIGEWVDAGETDQVDGILASLQADLAELANRNITAEAALQARTEFDSERDSLSERILKFDAFAPVTAIGGSAETAWKSGDFQQATTLFGQARQKLAQVLPSLESTDETKERVDKQTTRLKVEVSKLRSQLTIVMQERDEKITKTNNLQAQIATITAQSAGDREARDRYENQSAQIAQENDKLKNELASVRQELAKQQAAQSLAALKAGDSAEFTIAGVPTRFRYCPPCKKGEFKMGGPTQEDGRQSDETQVDVWFDKGFFMMETETTNELWNAVMNEKKGEAGKSIINELWNAVMNEKKGEAGKSKFPVVDVTQIACSDFVDRANDTLVKKSGPAGVYKLLLPTEAQWEYACRAGSAYRFCFGDSEAELGDYAWYDKNSGFQLHAAGTTKKANRWNIRDMHGSAWEWTADWAADRYEIKLMGGLNPTGPKTGSYRVIRGGSCLHDAHYVRSAWRVVGDPGTRDCDLGFRLALQFSQE